ncbi:oxidoreductase [Mangrovivirga sp. M17]|uniref:Oxidoreductase n=1 Tax=Mangrovivirga halotolerans TaxID=2993936 RepID=A0ABT3RW32_9BACT|nr:NAD-dependent epimerase/dehydratase family protein [Mangrovivirga halotolerans]MCX2745982.1 oxidoreductase [Mangrovivirga halotolerans]
MAKKTALILGSTGLVGEKLLNILIADNRYKKVISIVRRPSGNKNEKLQEVIIDFNQLAKELKKYYADDIFCCLGTTIKKAGSQEKFIEVDYDYPMVAANALKRSGSMQHYLIITALGANPESKIFYNRVKGEVERDLKRVNYASTSIFRPSLLLGNRDESRLGEDIFKGFSKIFGWIFSGPLKKYKPVKAEKVARAMHSRAQQNVEGIEIIESEQIQKY